MAEARTPFWEPDPPAQGEEGSGSEGVTLGSIQYADAWPWERVTLAGIHLPGVCTVISPGRTRKVHTIGGLGDEAEAVIDEGATAADVQIIVRIWTRDHLAQWETFSEAMQEAFAKAKEDAAAKKTSAEFPSLDVVHPGLNLAGIHSVYVYQVGVLQPSSTKGTMESTILGTEYRQRNKKTQGPGGQVLNSLDGLDKMQIAPELRQATTPQTPSQTEAGP